MGDAEAVHSNTDTNYEDDDEDYDIHSDSGGDKDEAELPEVSDDGPAEPKPKRARHLPAGSIRVCRGFMITRRLDQGVGTSVDLLV